MRSYLREVERLNIEERDLYRQVLDVFARPVTREASAANVRAPPAHCWGLFSERVPRATSPTGVTHGVVMGMHQSALAGWMQSTIWLGTRGDVMYVAVGETAILPDFPRGIAMRWETVRRTVWNEQKHTNEERELVYEISWIAEIGVWRRFLRSEQTLSR